ncbi:MAG: hypothetical protein R3F40_09950 [Candidatus Competibacteraceae bacterium]
MQRQTESRLFTELEQPALGEETLDVYLNAGCYWKRCRAQRGIQDWAATAQCRRSYRELELLGRPLSAYEALEFSGMARRIAALVLPRPKLDENYRACADQHIEQPPG